MAKDKSKAAARVRYRVIAPVFVNGSRVVPAPRGETFVFSDPGLEGSALELAPERSAHKEPPAE